ncbi:hypothetical protein MBENS4_3555 [Novosphingobium sp. MBES04]|nr:hypothetical protein MBENS4_3555 [Novosphingobium sp. MBES04]
MGFEVDDAADLPCRNGRLDREEIGITAPVVEGGDNAVCPLCARDKVLRARQIEGEGLVDDDVLARVQRLARGCACVALGVAITTRSIAGSSSRSAMSGTRARPGRGSSASARRLTTARRSRPV